MGRGKMTEYEFMGKDINGDWHRGNLSVLKVRVGCAEPGSYISNRAGLPFAFQVRPETVKPCQPTINRKEKEDETDV